MTAQSLPTRQFGKSTLDVATLCIGCAPLGDMPETFAYGVSEEQALATLAAAFASPINFLDTAASYGDGESERRIGLAIKAHGGVPAGYVIATKADRDAQTGDFSGDQMRRSVEHSQKLLGMDFLPIVYLHDPEHGPYAELMATGGAVETLLRLKEEGIIGVVGMAGGPVDLMARYVETGMFEALITHNRYTLLNRSADALLTLAAERGLAVMNAAPYGSGILAKGPSNYPRYAYQQAEGVLIERAFQLEAICQRHAVPLAAVALQFSLRDQRITSTILGISKPERIAQTLALATQPIADDLWQEIASVPFDSVDPEAGRWA